MPKGEVMDQNQYNEISTLDELLENVEKYINNEEEINTIKKAYNFAKKIHKNDKRLCGEDYILHPLNVSYILSKLYADSDTISTALLHDVITIGNADEELLKKEFSKEIMSLLKGVTTINKISLSAETENQINYFKKILIGLTEDVRIIIIKMAERTHNMRTLWAIPENKRREKAKETLEIMAPIAHRLGLSEMKTELEVLSLKYYKPTAYKSVETLLDNTEEERNKLVEKMKEEISNLLKENNIEFSIKGRAKSIYSIYNKMQKGKKFSEIYDIYALRIIVNTESECYQILGLIHSKYKPLPKRFKDYISNPKNNMYQSLHTTVFGEGGKYFEIQIRTKKMDEVAERGIASHWSYKEQGKKMQQSMEEKLQFFRNIIELNNQNLSEEDYIDAVKHEIVDKNIYVYTPNGDVFELPIGATPIDFAYRVHTKIGETMVGAIVNDNIVSLNTELKTGDIVKINTNKSSTPSLEWLSYVKTNQAKNKIKSYFSKIDKKICIDKGKEALNREIRRRKLSINDTISELPNFYSQLKLDNENDLYLSIGTGKITPNFVINLITEENKTIEEQMIEKISNKGETKLEIKNDILVSGIDEIKVTLANCCRPIKGDNIVGFISKGNGVIVHHIDCKNIKNNERLIDVCWNTDIDKKFPVKINIITDQKENLLINIISVASSNNVSIIDVNTLKNQKNYVFKLKIEVESLEILNKFFNSLTSSPDVINVERVFE